MGRLEACCGGFHSCLREASGQSESGASPAWLAKAHHLGQRSGRALAAVQEERLEYKLTESFKQHGVVDERTLGPGQYVGHDALKLDDAARLPARYTVSARATREARFTECLRLSRRDFLLLDAAVRDHMQGLLTASG